MISSLGDLAHGHSSLTTEVIANRRDYAMKRCSKKAKLENILRRVPMDLVLLVKVAVKKQQLCC